MILSESADQCLSRAREHLTRAETLVELNARQSAYASAQRIVFIHLRYNTTIDDDQRAALTAIYQQAERGIAATGGVIELANREREEILTWQP